MVTPIPPIPPPLQGERFPIPPKSENEEWHDYFAATIGSDQLSAMSLNEIRDKWGDYIGRIWLQCEYEDYCRGRSSIRIVDSKDRHRDAHLAEKTSESLQDNLVEILLDVFDELRDKKDSYKTHQELSRLELALKLFRPTSSDPLKRGLRRYARETIELILQSAKYQNKHQTARFKANDFIQDLGIRFATITDLTLFSIRKSYSADTPNPASSNGDNCPECSTPFVKHEFMVQWCSDNNLKNWCFDCNGIGSGDATEIKNNQLVHEKIAYNVTLLLLEYEWVSVKNGNFDDLLLIQGKSEDEIDITKPYPTMLYFSNRLYDMIHDNHDRKEGRSRQTYVKNIHAVFRWYSMDRDRWCYAEPDDHYWKEAESSEPRDLTPPSTDDELFDYDFDLTRYENRGYAKARGYLTTEGKDLVDSTIPERGPEIEDSGHRIMRKLVFNQEEHDSLGIGRTKGTPGEQNITALNNLQKTQWEINLDFLNAIATPRSKEGKSIDFTSGRYVEHPDKFVLKESIIRPGNSETLAEWEDLILSSYIPKILNFSKNTFWHVWCCDFRGRLFSRCAILSPQASDMDRALLRFKEWKPLGQRGWHWLCVHTYNLLAGIGLNGQKPPFGKRASFDNRARWIQQEDNLAAIVRIASNPIRYESEWQEKPRPKGETLQRLAAILEVARVWNLHTKSKMEWGKITCGLPIQLDASNNGWQHISALLRDEGLAKKVNVILEPNPDNPDLPVQDLYMRVSEKAKENWTSNSSELSKKYSTDERFSSEKMEKIFERKFAKQITMTMAYGAISVDRIYSGNKNKKPEYKRKWFVLAGKDESSGYECKEHGEKFDDFESFSTHVIQNHSDVEKDWLVGPIFETDIPLTAPSWAPIKDGYGSPTTRTWTHLRNLNTNRKRSNKPPIWVGSWHPDSLLRTVFGEFEFNQDEQDDIASKLSTDYKNAVIHVTNNTMKTGQDCMHEAINQSTNNIFRWSTPTHFRIRNFYSKWKETKWSAHAGGAWNVYWGSKSEAKKLTASIVSLFTLIEKILGENARIDDIIREAFMDKNGEFKDLENIFLSMGITQELPDYVARPWTLIKENKLMSEFDNQLNPKNKVDRRKIKICLMNYLAERKLHPLWVTKSATDEDLRAYTKLQRSLLLSISYNPGRYQENVTKIRDDDSVSKANTIQKMKQKLTPNYVHSLDAAHMVLTINKMFSEHGIRDFWAVHDCFAVHATDTDTLVSIIPQTFHQIYADLSLEDVPGGNFELPADAFDIDRVLESEYIIG